MPEPRSHARTHPCRWPGCPRQVPAEMYACKAHWFALPKPIRDAIWAAYRPGQDAETASPQWHEAHEAALAFARRYPRASSLSSERAPKIRALTISQPWAWLIARGFKPIENRSWYTTHRGPLAIHAGRGDQYRELFDEIREETGLAIPDWDRLDKGAVVALATLRDVVKPEAITLRSEREWSEGPWCWRLADVRPLDHPVRSKGAQGLWWLNDVQARGVIRETSAEGSLFPC